MPSTPWVHVDVEVMNANIVAMQTFCDERGIALRPHAKTHKMLPVARAQLAAGAVGLATATAGEAEVFAPLLAEHGADVLIAYPVHVDAARLARLVRQVPVGIGVDSVSGVELAAAAGTAVSIEIDSGLHRSGVGPGAAGELAAEALARGVPVTGVFTFPGHGYALADGGDRSRRRRAAAQDEATALQEAAAALVAAGVATPVRSGGCTPTAEFTDPTVVTELRPGVYVFGDAGQVALGAATAEQVALTIRATVVSTAVEGQFVIDAGAKVLGMDAPPFVSGHGVLPAYPDARLTRIWEHHGVVVTGTGPRPRVGEQIVVVPNHVCATVNLVDEVWAASERWPVAARGRNS